MRLTTVFNKLLALQGAFVRDVKFTPDRLLVIVAPRRQLHRCPLCRFETTSRYDHRVCEWRHVALGKWKVVLCASVARVDCPEHGVLVEEVPWAEPEARFTRDFEDLVAWLAREMTMTAVTKLLRVSWAAVQRMVVRVVERKLDKARLDDLFTVGIDEVSYRKGHKYLCVVADHATGDPAWIGEGRSRATVGQFFDELGPERSAKLKVVTMDMCAPFIAEVRERAPNAEIAFDPFHVVKLANEAVHQVRRSEARDLKGTAHADVLKGSRWALLKAPENLRLDEQLRLAAVASLNAPVYRAYLLKEELRMLYRCSAASAEKHLRAWCAWASRSRLKPFIRLAATLRKYRDGVLASIRLGVSNGRLEGINNKIGVLKHRAYGFHSPMALIAMIFLTCCDLNIQLPT